MRPPERPSRTAHQPVSDFHFCEIATLGYPQHVTPPPPPRRPPLTPTIDHTEGLDPPWNLQEYQNEIFGPFETTVAQATEDARFDSLADATYQAVAVASEHLLSGSGSAMPIPAASLPPTTYAEDTIFSQQMGCFTASTRFGFPLGSTNLESASLSPGLYPVSQPLHYTDAHIFPLSTERRRNSDLHQLDPYASRYVAKSNGSLSHSSVSRCRSPLYRYLPTPEGTQVNDSHPSLYSPYVYMPSLQSAVRNVLP